MFSTNAIVFDYSNLCQRCLHLPQVGADKERPAWDLMDYMIFDKILSFVNSYAEENTDIILAMDSRGDYWRRQYYHLYKGDRAAKREASGIDYKTAYMRFDALADTIRQYLPWKVVQVPTCEADDIIYMVTNLYQGDIIINSADSDYIQLVSERVRLYRPHEEDWFSFPYKGIKDSKTYLQVAILTGQAGKDNVYNVKTPTEWLPENGRKPGLGLKSALKIIDSGIEPTLRAANLWHNYVRNELVIDMVHLPEALRADIEQALSIDNRDTCDIMGFFYKKGWPSYAPGTSAVDIAVETIALVAGIPYTAETPPLDDFEEEEIDISDIQI